MCATYAINIADRYLVTTVMEPMRIDLHLSDSGVALLTGPPLALFYVTMGIPISWFADHSNRRNILSVALIAWSGMTTLCGLSQNWLQFLLARIGVGIGEAGGTPPSNSIVADYFPASKRATATTLVALGAPLGAWIGADIAGAVSDAYGWRAAFLALGGPGVLLGVLILTTIREPKRGQFDSRVMTEKATFKQSIVFLWRQRACIHVMAGAAICGLWGWGLMWFTPTFLQRSYQLTAGEAGAVLGPIHMIAGSGASIVTAWLVSRPTFTDSRHLVLLLAASAGLATIPSFIIYYTTSLAVAKFMLWIFVPVIYLYIGPATALILNLAPPTMRSTFIAISLMFGNTMNLIVAPQGVGFLSDIIAGPNGPNAASLRLALLILAPTGFWASYHYWAAAKTIADDQIRAIGDV